MYRQSSYHVVHLLPLLVVEEVTLLAVEDALLLPKVELQQKANTCQRVIETENFKGAAISGGFAISGNDTKEGAVGATKPCKANPNRHCDAARE